MSDAIITNANDLAQRLGLAAQLGYSYDGKRDLYSTLGYKRVLTFDDYQNAYDRQDIAARIVDALPNDLWRRFPNIWEDNGEEEELSPFETAWQALVERLAIPQYIEIVDKVAGIGQYALLFLGASDTDELSRPLERVPKNGGVQYLSVFNQRQVTINQFELDHRNPRFGKPTEYQIDLGAGHNTMLLAMLPNRGSVRVHYTRVIHVAEDTMGDGIIGTPRLQKVMNRLDDLQKCVGGAAEVFWLAAWNGLVAEMDKDARLNASDQQTQDEFDKYIHGLQRYLRVKGMKVYSLGSETPHPAETVDVIIQMIAAATGIPKRILTGSERGELASSQDAREWTNKVIKRQQYAWDVILRPLVTRLIEIGVLPAPTADIFPEWDNKYEQTPIEEAQVALTKTQALAAYTSSPELVVPPSEFVQWLGLEPSVVEQAQQEAGDVPLDETNPDIQQQFIDTQGPQAAATQPPQLPPPPPQQQKAA